MRVSNPCHAGMTDSLRARHFPCAPVRRTSRRGRHGSFQEGSGFLRRKAWAVGPCGASSVIPDGPAALKRLRHSRTVGCAVSNCFAIGLLDCPSTASRQRGERRTGVVLAFIHIVTILFCSVVMGNASNYKGIF